MMVRKLLLLKVWVVTSITLIVAACGRETSSTNTNPPTYDLQLRFVNFMGNDTAKVNTNYTNAAGEVFSLTNFQYYISNIACYNSTSGRWETLDGQYYLVSIASDSSRIINLKVSNRNYSQIRFLLGVDSTRNVSGVQSGALDPLNGMFWTWNSGYIMAKLEGWSNVSTAPANSMSYHIGGFRTGENAARTITFNLTTAISIPTNGKSIVTLHADGLRWFTGVHNLRIATQAIVHNPGVAAMRFADNYERMFTLVNVQN
ncbi:MAG TPA: hypothetical protein DCL43_15490 [Chitinophagaceae bacterium]|nr:hypothetical protein [Chitinophagaceae bacterium]